MVPRFSKWAYGLFWLFFKPFFRSRIHRIYMWVNAQHIDPQLPLLCVANHVSWWDGFLLLELHKHLQRRGGFYTIMLEKELAQRPYFRWLGCLGIQPGSLASLRQLLQSLQILKKQESAPTLCFFPQGKIWPSTKKDILYPPGIDKIAAVMAPVNVLPIALRMEPLNTSAPQAFIAAASPITMQESHEARGLSATLQGQIESLQSQMDLFLCHYGENSGHHFSKDFPCL